MQITTRQAFALATSIAWAPVVLAQGTPPPVTLEAFVDRIARDGLAARVAAADLAAADAETQAVGIWPNPRLDLSRQANAAGVRAGETQDQVLVSLPLVVSGRLGLERESVAEEVAAARARLAHARGRLRHEATAVFIEIAAARRQVATLGARIDALHPVVAAITARERAGSAAGYERARIELEVARLKDSLAAAQSEEQRAFAHAHALWPPDAGVLLIADHDLWLTLRVPSDPPLERRGDLRALLHSTTAASLASDAAGRSWVPEPTPYGGGYVLDVIERERGVGYVVGIEIPLPAFDRRQGDAARARARAARDSAARAHLLNDAVARLAAARSAADAARQRSQRHDETVVQGADALLAITVQAYAAGGMELLALVDAERVQTDAQLASIALQLAARRAENDLALISGSYDDDRDSADRTAP